MPGSLVEWVAAVLALAYVVLAIRQQRACWIAAATSSVLYVAIFLDAGLPMQALLNGYYVAMAAYGWRTWGANDGQGSPASVRSWRPALHLAVMGVLTLGSLAYAWRTSDPRGPAVAFADAWVAVGSMVATWMMTRKVLENWLYWVLLDTVAAMLYASQGLFATTGLFVIYVVLAVRGYLEWRRVPAPAGAA